MAGLNALNTGYHGAAASSNTLTMPESIFEIPSLQSQEDADAVMFELQDLPCIGRAEVDLGKRQAWVSHTAMISVEDIAAALEAAGYAGRLMPAAL